MYLLFFLAFYIILVFTDLIPVIRAKKKKYLWLYIPVYAVTLAANIIIGMSFRFTSITEVLEKFMSGFIK